MQLIVASSTKDDGATNQWSDRDIELLRTLYEEKQCPIDILVAIFKRSENEIKNKISEIIPME